MIRYSTQQVNAKLFNTYSEENKNTVMIMEKDVDTGVWMPSSLTHYIYAYYSNLAINTQESVGYLICDFMNYILHQVELGEDRVFDNLKSEGLYGLNFLHGAKFLHYLSNEKPRKVKGTIVLGNNYKTVMRKQNELIYFYDFLRKKGITNEYMQVEFEVGEKYTMPGYKSGSKVTSKGKKVLINPFDDCGVDITYPSKDSKSIGARPKLADMRKSDWELLLEVAEEETPDIAFGVAMQFMGGLRAGEVVNQVLSSYKVDKKGDKILLDIQDRQGWLFKNRGIKTDKSQVKKPRKDQPVFDFNGQLFNLLEKHLNYLKDRPRNNTRALFVDLNGNAMAGEVYHTRFAFLKECFLQKLAERKPALAKDYKENYKWGSHIGRHIYTNYLIKTGLCNDATGKPSAQILANLRGDKSLNSAYEYIDRIAVLESIQSRLEELSRISIET
ncbi:hypothetical protein [Clostridium ljungdahlii]|uniref:Phage integrase family protein n=1 Tax=Clostridium ljungdahlii TaxID=1538 RepID=A0A168RBG2_9CLOT|nr:hypothetical protein [Clostridium ljungdahlii]OAA90491.1 hypothetical protein WY13_01395 [Clostridium ljungdahlii]